LKPEMADEFKRQIIVTQTIREGSVSGIGDEQQ
jgi:hypothetical protein